MKILSPIFVSADSPTPQNFNDDLQMLSAFRGGDPGAFERVYLDHFDDLCHYVTALVGGDSAGDIVHDVLCAVWDARAKLPVKTERELQYYLVRAVRNRAITVHRRERAREEKLSEWRYDLNAGVSSGSLGDDSQVDDEHAFDIHALLPRVRDLIAALPTRSREVLTLRWYHGYNFEQIAGIMGVSYGYVRVLHSRAMTTVRKHLGLA